MSLTKLKIGEFIEKYNEKCNIPDLTKDDVSGINREKEFFEPTVQIGSNTKNYKVVPPGYFACNLMHVGRDEVLPIALNHTNSNKIVSPAYTVFRIIDKAPLLTEYFFMLIKSEQTDRFFWFNTDSSVRDGMTWNDFCDLEFTLPDISIQEKYADIYKALLANQESYQAGLEDLREMADYYIAKVKKDIKYTKIGPYIKLSSKKNTKLDYGIDRVRGISIDKKFITTKADMSGVNLKNYSIVNQRSFAYVTVTSRNGDKISLAFNDGDSPYICSSSYVVFEVDESTIYPEYLRILFSQSDFDRYARFHSWGSARETFGWEDMMNVSIPIPELNIQKAVADIYEVYLNRRRINEKLKARINLLCPILIRGAVEEASTTGRE